MKRQLSRCTLYSILTYLALSALNSAITASQSLGENGRRFCGFDDRQPDSPRYVRTFRKKLRVRFSTNGPQFLANPQWIEPHISDKED